jgi:hypothetical protein
MYGKRKFMPGMVAVCTWQEASLLFCQPKRAIGTQIEDFRMANGNCWILLNTGMDVGAIYELHGESGFG